MRSLLFSFFQRVRGCFSSAKIENKASLSPSDLKSYHYALMADLKRFVGVEDKKVLVVGCGKGLECEIFRQSGAAQIIGLDVHQTIGAEFSDSSIIYVKCSAEQMSFQDSQFDIVASFATLEHIANPKEALEEMIRVTTKDGIIYCQAAPLWNSPFGHHKRDLFPNDPWIHLRKRSAEGMQAFYGDYCNEIVNDDKISNHIDYVFSKAFNRYSVRGYKALISEVLQKVSPLSIRFGMNLEHRQLFTAEIRKAMQEYPEEELLTVSLTLVLRKV